MNVCRPPDVRGKSRSEAVVDTKGNVDMRNLYRPKLNTIRVVRVALSYKLEALMATVETNWTDEERDYPRQLRENRSIPGQVRMIQDAFASVCGQLQVFGEDYDILRDLIFYDWRDWGP